MTTSKEQSDRGLALMPGEERRRSQRVIIRIPVTLELTKSGQVIKIPAHTVAVNVHGAMVAFELEADRRLVKPALGSVVWE